LWLWFFLETATTADRVPVVEEEVA